MSRYPSDADVDVHRPNVMTWQNECSDDKYFSLHWRRVVVKGQLDRWKDAKSQRGALRELDW